MKIEKMTEEQQEKMIAFREEWRKIGLATGAADIKSIQNAINSLYADIGKEPPYIWRVNSPLMANLVLNVLSNLRANLRANLEANLWANLEANLGDNLWANLEANLRANLEANLGDNLWANLEANLRANLRANLEANLWDNLWDNLWANLGDNLGVNLGNSLRANLWDNLWDNLEANLEDNLGVNLRNSLRANLWANLWDNLWANLESNLRDKTIKYFMTSFWGSLDAYWISYYLFPHVFIKEMHTKEQIEKLHLWEELARNCFWWYPYENVCVVCDRPSYIGMDDQYRMHNDTGAAVSFSDGWDIYAIHGVMVPKQVVMMPESLTVQQIDEEQNVEVRRIMLDRFGLDRYIQESGTKPIQADEYGTLYRKEIDDDEPLVMVRVTNSTPEPDGTYKDYFLRVPPNMTTAHEAVAWTFETTPDVYAPEFET